MVKQVHFNVVFDFYDEMMKTEKIRCPVEGHCATENDNNMVSSKPQDEASKKPKYKLKEPNICDLLTTTDIVPSVGVEYEMKYILGRQISSSNPAPTGKELLTIRTPSYGQHVHMKRSSSAAKLAMSNKLMSPY